MKSLLPTIGLLVLLAGCTPPPKTQVDRGNLTMGSVQQKIENNKTTKSEILQNFGSPNIVTKDRDGEIWNYTRQGTATEMQRNSVGAWFLVFYGGSSTGFSKSGSYSFDLLIKFNNSDIVVDHKVMQTAF